MSRILVVLSVLFAAQAFWGAASAAESFAVYSDVCLHRETGDLLGTRIALMRFADATYVFVQIAEGQLEEPLVSEMSGDPARTGRLEFKLADGGTPISFRGKISDGAVIGRFEPTALGRVFHLRRVRMPETHFPECR